MVILNILGAIAFILTLIGLYLLGEKRPMAHIIFLGSYGIQFYIFWDTKQPFLFFQMIALSVFAIINYKKWTKGGGENYGRCD